MDSHRSLAISIGVVELATLLLSAYLFWMYFSLYRRTRLDYLLYQQMMVVAMAASVCMRIPCTLIDFYTYFGLLCYSNIPFFLGNLCGMRAVSLMAKRLYPTSTFIRLSPYLMLFVYVLFIWPDWTVNMIDPYGQFPQWLIFYQYLGFSGWECVVAWVDLAYCYTLWRHFLKRSKRVKPEMIIRVRNAIIQIVLLDFFIGGLFLWSMKSTLDRWSVNLIFNLTVCLTVVHVFLVGKILELTRQLLQPTKTTADNVQVKVPTDEKKQSDIYQTDAQSVAMTDTVKL
ncbi:hypothetical protein EDD86DRAFT_127124 [Gorgonomyces haynaldii]|nr:hypothetical protein EDD86DRAFT_127124 [Gorgonomyces haynaldii]